MGKNRDLKKHPYNKDEIKAIVKMYENDLKSQSEVGKAFKTTQAQIRRILKKHGNPDKQRNQLEGNRMRRVVNDEVAKKLYEKYKNNVELTTRDLAEEIEVQRQTLELAFKRNGFKLRDSLEAAANKTRTIKNQDVKELCRLHLKEKKSIKDLATKYNCSTDTIIRTLRIHGKVDVNTAFTYWDRNKIIKYAKKLIENYGQIPDNKELRLNHRGWEGSIPRHIEGGMYGLYEELGIQPKQIKAPNLSKEETKQLCELYKFGFTTEDLAFKFETNSYHISKILEAEGIEKRPRGGGDSIEMALAGSGRFNITKETEYYIVGINGFPDHLKPGISYDLDDRAGKSYGFYGEEHLVKTLSTRVHAFFLEEAILSETINYADVPLILEDWGGRTELRKMKPDELIKIFDFYVKELEILGPWEFAVNYVPMSPLHKEECKKRIGIEEEYEKETN